MSYPRVVVDLSKVKENTKLLVEKCSRDNISVMGVTKVFCAYPEITKAMIDGGISYIADSRIENLEKAKDFKIPKVLLRLPMRSQIDRVVKGVDISCNSEIGVIREVGLRAKTLGVVHKIILMVELGDLREGIIPKDLEKAVEEILTIEGIKIAGLGVNLTCYGGIIPDERNLGELVELADLLKEKYKLEIEIISGGNSSSLYLLDKERLPKGINNLRLGEAIALGRETAYGDPIEGTNDDTYILEAEIIELKEKNSIPTGEIGMDAFGNKPQFEDRGVRKRAILAIGRQDIDPDGLIATDKNIFILGASSDHLIMDVHESDISYKVGDIIRFKLEYGALLKVMTSSYVEKEFVEL